MSQNLLLNSSQTEVNLSKESKTKAETRDAALLLTSMTAQMMKEIITSIANKPSCKDYNNTSLHESIENQIPIGTRKLPNYSSRLTSLCSPIENGGQDSEESDRFQEQNKNSRTRTISFESQQSFPIDQSLPPYNIDLVHFNSNIKINDDDSGYFSPDEKIYTLDSHYSSVTRTRGKSTVVVSPPTSPCRINYYPNREVSVKMRHLHSASDKIKGTSFVITQENINSTKKNVSTLTNKNKTIVKKVLRKKFNWKNYPQLENFLIANRSEYLRHSALNYTMQQKKYNNHLTERLLKLANELDYVFDKNVFSFVKIRDRIRCYFKSYVQSSKKRGFIIGYAARKAGLITATDLMKMAALKGKINVPIMR